MYDYIENTKQNDNRYSSLLPGKIKKGKETANLIYTDKNTKPLVALA